MPKKEIEPIVKVTLNLYERDYLRMKALHPTLGPAKAIRALVRSYVARIDNRLSPQTTDGLIVELELEDE